jgi:hypothetical protein
MLYEEYHRYMQYAQSVVNAPPVSSSGFADAGARVDGLGSSDPARRAGVASDVGSRLLVRAPQQPQRERCVADEIHALLHSTASASASIEAMAAVSSSQPARRTAVLVAAQRGDGSHAGDTGGGDGDGTLGGGAVGGGTASAATVLGTAAAGGSATHHRAQPRFTLASVVARSSGPQSKRLRLSVPA